MKVYFMSIGGTGMGHAALLLREAGHEVLGCDKVLYPPMSDTLAAAGIAALPGFDAERLAQIAPDVVIVGNVNTRGNPEIEWLLENRQIPLLSLPEALHRFVLSSRKNLVVAGTHGKTTTTTLLAYLLDRAGAQPGWFIGGVPFDLPSGAAVGRSGGPFAIEGDEYDSAFFDKRSKFIHYAPHIAILNNLEFDHADIFRDLGDIQRTFSHLVRLVPRNGFILANGDDPALPPVVDVPWTTVLRVGTGKENDLQIRGFKEDRRGSSFQLVWRGTTWGKVTWQLPGLFNARNAAMAALAAGLALKPDDPFCALDLDALAKFRGVKRRQEILYDDGETTLISDFGHHPTAISGTLDSLRARFPGRPLVACFEARSNTTVRRIHQTEFTEAFRRADRVHLGAIFRAERYAPESRIDFDLMANDLGDGAVHYSDNAALAEGLHKSLTAEPRQVVVFFSNGSFDGAMQQVRSAMPPVR